MSRSRLELRNAPNVFEREARIRDEMTSLKEFLLI
jgi:hypothetical protein